MASTETTPLRRFADYYEQLSGLWQSIDVRAGVISVGGQDALLHLAVRLDPRGVRELEAPPFSPTIKGLYTAYWEARPISDLLSILADLEGGRVRVGGLTFNAPRRQEGDRLSWQPGFVGRGRRSKGIEYVRGSCAYLVAWGIPLHDLCDSAFEARLDHGWQSSATPFLDEVDVLRSYFGLEVRRNRNTGVLLQCLAPVPVELGELGFRDNALAIEVKAAPTATEGDIRVGWITDGGKLRSNLTCSKVTWTDGGGGYRVCTLVCPGPVAREAVVLLRYRGVSLEEQRVHNAAWHSTNPAVQVHEYFDPGLKAFRKTVYGDEGSTKPAQNFEAGVAWLLAFCGLPPIVYSRTAVHDEVDLVVYRPEERIVVCVECTVGGPTKDDKLNKLYKRSRELAERMPDHEVLAVLATQWRGDLDLTDEEKASLREKRVALLAKENLERLEEMTLTHASRAEVLEYLRDCVPKEKGLLSPAF